MTQSKMTFLLERLQTLQNLANWPNANVPVTALVTEYIPELCKVPYDYLASQMTQRPGWNVHFLYRSI